MSTKYIGEALMCIIPAMFWFCWLFKVKPTKPKD